MLALLDNLSDKHLLQGWAVVSVLVFATYYRWPGRRLDHIPAVGSTSQLWSFLVATEFLFNARHVVQRGCEKYRNSIFRIPNLDRWMVLVHGADLIQDLRKAPEEELSLMDAIDESLQVDYTLGRNVQENPYHVPIVRTQLTRNLSALFPKLHEEVVEAFNDVISANENEWTKLNATETMMPVVCRASNCIFVGAPLCRDPDYMKLNIKFTITVVKASKILLFTPPFLRPLVSKFCTSLSSDVAHGVKHLQPLIEERRQKIQEFGQDYPDKPNDFLSWLMDEAKGEETSCENLARRILTLNFAAIHTSSMTFTHTLYYLAAHPEYADILREEVAEIVHREGWTFSAMNKMVKVDSFMKETQRLNSLGCITMTRVVRRPFTFSDGSHLPVGTLVAVPSHAIHLDESNYSDPLAFRPWRFIDEIKKENIGRRQDMTSTHTDFLPFGYGRHACPGRFFAANELKLMLAHLVMNYDMKLEGPRPEPWWILISCVPNPKGEVLFRRRIVAED